MRALVKDQGDHTLIAAEIIAVSYDPLRGALHLDVMGDNDEIIIPLISREKADSITKEIYSSGCTDLTEYDAWCNETPVLPVRTEDDEINPVHAGLFTRRKIAETLKSE